MKPTIKVSIGGRAFNLEEDAYILLDNYLTSLKAHFEDNPESEEIINDIESRMSELLQMRLKNTEEVISMSDAKEITDIMGNPKDFDHPEKTDSPEKEKSHDKKRNKKQINTAWAFKKRFYRDTVHGIIGGVCSGLGHYFKIDPVIFRLAFVILCLPGIFGNYPFFFSKISGIIFLLYIILWIITPKATTFNQRLAMTGSDPSIENIQNRTQLPPRAYKGSSVTRILVILLKVFACLVILSMLFSLIGILFSFTWLHFDSDIFGINNYLILLGLNGVEFKIPFLLIVGIPIIAIISLLLKLLRSSPFTIRTAVIFAIGLVLWLGSIFVVVSKGVKKAYFFQDETVQIEEVSVNTNSNSFFIRLDDFYMNAENQPNNEAIYYKGKKEKERSLFILPKIKIEEDTLITNYIVEIRKSGFGNTESTTLKNMEKGNLNYTLQDSLLTIKPTIFSMKNPWDRILYEVTIKVPEGKKVEINPPLKNHYSLSFNKDNFYW